MLFSEKYPAYFYRVRKTCTEGERYPVGYGVSYYEENADVVVMFPIPLNMIITLIRSVYFWVRGFGYRDKSFSCRGCGFKRTIEYLQK